MTAAPETLAILEQPAVVLSGRANELAQQIEQVLYLRNAACWVPATMAAVCNVTFARVSLRRAIH